MVRLAESSMNNGASEICPTRLASFAHASSLIRPARMSDKRISVSADSRRITISLFDISSEKITDALLCLIEHERIKSSASVDLPTPGRAATMII